MEAALPRSFRFDLLTRLNVLHHKEGRYPDGSRVVGLPVVRQEVVHVVLGPAERRVYEWLFGHLRAQFRGARASPLPLLYP